MADHTHPRCYLKALTLEAQSALHGHRHELDVLPFRVGRESRGPDAHWLRSGNRDRRTGSETPNNELYLWEQTDTIYVSREHFLIDWQDDHFVLTDRASAMGTWVEGQLVGGHRHGGTVPLHHGDVIIVGGLPSGFLFKFLIEEQS